ncbi:hypothetical protein BO94DRAFT_591527 [Aspergillus sclerotioniger CBS 115572]|nr:hypothetical protein BO94DRAFT_591571 [Aspergillus sclerotioniger CBS 115572]XP_025461257.1 hypothetical protein BO94DRAFT_591560 [Aspergillus sclerotioniger CBS 115572]XP_025461303.1 hypothetical protein BO94DRAFT_591527 [Aspergillus sclerotioniger CBS 115572]PWY63699.1 hypothetical protein BO94DRAFT_591571 [Aspergillus sclerotioniger CBS 115572]PWY63863.1 hypothetical protein BO94DRAFT_591560 [Aspergillus sclerotioniger CBS 115572]PWY64508.1 hypothetical protein BO94DRAFT_591527 [Aspergil
MHLSRLATALREKPLGAGWRIAMSPRAGMNPLQTTEVTKRVVAGRLEGASGWGTGAEPGSLLLLFTNTTRQFADIHGGGSVTAVPRVSSSLPLLLPGLPFHAATEGRGQLAA